ncbi:glycine zipper 2TM domain-containing protein [Xanthomonas sp.]|uniref:glycine zipper 2TM domain-containing protein n=1 Tax=Xanthomonas sp. TaxID=29446 RepID=UPI002403D2BE|nr:glycine zipper 2TM domain-containing protein [Xanthomonas sp.]
MKSNTTTILVAAGALLVGGVATAAFMNNRDKPDFVSNEGQPTLDNSVDGDAVAGNGVGSGKLEYADVVKIDPITQKEERYATVIGTEALRETSTTTTPREVCQDVVVQERLPERDGNVGGTVAGAVIGGLLGNQVGGGNGRKAATAAGAVAGGFVGNRVDRNHVGGRVVNRTERQCHTENSTAESSRITGYNVTYRNEDGSTGTMRMDSKPGSRISMGKDDVVKGYEVTYRYDGQEKTVRMDDKPNSDRLPVLDGRLVTQTASVDDGVSQR